MSDQQILIEAIIIAESGGDDNAIGDTNLVFKAYGPMQIRQPYVADVNRHYGTKHSAIDCLGDRKLSVDIFKKYMAIYATEERLGRPVTDEDCARIHNGGPDGYKKQSTVSYWNKVRTLIHGSDYAGIPRGNNGVSELVPITATMPVSSVEITQNSKGEPRVTVKVYNENIEEARMDATRIYHKLVIQLAREG